MGSYCSTAKHICDDEKLIVVNGVSVDKLLPKTPYEDENNDYVWITVHEFAKELKTLQIEGFVITQPHETINYYVRMRKIRDDKSAICRLTKPCLVSMPLGIV